MERGRGAGPKGPSGRVVCLDDLPADVGSPEVVVVVDVIRAFTTAVAAFEAGARESRCVAGLDEARALARSIPGSVLMGEERGLRPDGFDLGNSPREIIGLDLAGSVVVQRTSNGTRGLVRFGRAPTVLAMAAANVGATAAWIGARHHQDVLVVATGMLTEDRACGEHLAALLAGARPSPGDLRAAILSAAAEHQALWSRPRKGAEAEAFLDDVAACAEVDTSDLVLRGRLDGQAVVLNAEVG